MPALNRVGQLFCHGSAEENIDVADIPFVKGFRRQAFCHLKPEAGLVVHRKGIGEIRRVVGVVIIIAVVAEEQTHAVTLRIQGIHAERVVAADGPVLTGGVDQGLHLPGEVHVLHGVDGVERVEGHGIANLTLLRVLLGEELIGDVATEVAVVLQDRACHRGA